MWWKSNCTRIAVILTLFAWHTTTLAQSSLWKIQTANSQDFLVRAEQRFALEASNVKPEIKEVKIHGGYEVVIYKANVSGTSQMVEVYAGAIYDRKKKKIIATPAYEYKGLSAEEQPQWTFLKDGSIKVEDPDLPKTRSFPAP